MDRLSLPGTLDSLEAIGAFILRVSAEAGLERRASYRLRLAVDEIATNTVVHGYEESGLQGTIDIWAEIDDSDLRVVLEDSAGPFDPRQTAPPKGMDLPLEERAIGGLGVFLALRGVDALEYERIGDRNRSTFVMHRPSSSAGT